MKKYSIYRLASLFILISFLVGTNLVVQAASQFASASATALTFNPVADVYVVQTSASTNYGTGTSLRVDSSPETRSYLRFVISGLNGRSIQTAFLRIYANSANSTGFSVRAVSNNTWVENQITYSNAPAAGNIINSSKSFAAGTWMDVDVSTYIKAAGTFSLVLTTSSSTNTNLASREDPSHAPQLVVTTGSGQGVPTSTPTSVPPGSGTGNILLIAGDICKHNFDSVDYTANCKKTGDLVRSVLGANPGAQVQTLGDNVNNDGGTSSYDAEYQDLYAPNWGSFLNVTHALMGNHDTYPPSGDTAYFNYFGNAAGPQPGGYYSYNIGSSWHVIVLNAQCSKAGGCGASSVQTTWLKNDLAANTRQCVLAVWHQPRWTSGRHADDATYAPWWNLLYQYKADIIAGGHNHNYERFDQIDAQEQAASDGIREFVVGTGGAPGDGYTYASHPLDPNEVIRNQTPVYGVLKLTLSVNSYSWKFLPAAGYTFSDSGTSTCH
ncbi:MAG: DNRLRE domain-containing protein [Anaerolineales bacterium]